MLGSEGSLIVFAKTTDCVWKWVGELCLSVEDELRPAASQGKELVWKYWDTSFLGRIMRLLRSILSAQPLEPADNLVGSFAAGWGCVCFIQVSGGCVGPAGAPCAPHRPLW